MRNNGSSSGGVQGSPQRSVGNGSQLGSRTPPAPSPREAVRRLSVMRFTAAITNELPWYIARCLEVEVTSQGETVEEALGNLREALEFYFEDEPLPDHIDTPIIAPVDIPACAQASR